MTLTYQVDALINRATPPGPTFVVCSVLSFVCPGEELTGPWTGGELVVGRQKGALRAWTQRAVSRVLQVPLTGA